MRAKTELFLYLLSWHLDGTFYWSVGSVRDRDDSFEAWVYRNGLQRQIARLEERAYLERLQEREKGDRVYRLTELGRVTGRGGTNPQAWWDRPWDGVWRVVAFDLPEFNHAVRERWRRELRRLKFGCLQGSVWVAPDSVDEIKRALEDAAVRTQRLIFIQGRPAAGESDQDIVAAAWNFEHIDDLYRQHRRTLERILKARPTFKPSRKWLLTWAQQEHAGWKEIIKTDPFLPRPLLPAKYQGISTAELRNEALNRAAYFVRRLG